jgi:hypothetical protein
MFKNQNAKYEAEAEAVAKQYTGRGGNVSNE